MRHLQSIIYRLDQICTETGSRNISQTEQNVWTYVHIFLSESKACKSETQKLITLRSHEKYTANSPMLHKDAVRVFVAFLTIYLALMIILNFLNFFKLLCGLLKYTETS